MGNTIYDNCYSPTVKFPGGYQADDPSISIDIYGSTATTYAYVLNLTFCILLGINSLFIF